MRSLMEKLLSAQASRTLDQLRVNLRRTAFCSLNGKERLSGHSLSLRSNRAVPWCYIRLVSAPD
jgi:hypothetical protein